MLVVEARNARCWRIPDMWRERSDTYGRACCQVGQTYCRRPYLERQCSLYLDHQYGSVILRGGQDRFRPEEATASATGSGCLSLNSVRCRRLAWKGPQLSPGEEAQGG